ncbi:MAG: NADH-quinone oxidoreductase subunit A [Desulfuromonadales bacterium]
MPVQHIPANIPSAPPGGETPPSFEALVSLGLYAGIAVVLIFVFDVEAIFIVSWAVAYDLLGWAGFLQIVFFIAILFLALIYLWRRGGLDWGPSGHPATRGPGGNR